MGRSLDHLLSLILLLVEHVLVLYREVVAVAAGHCVAKGFPLQGQLPGPNVHNLHILRAVHRIWEIHTRHKSFEETTGSR